MTHLQAWADIAVETDARGVQKQTIAGIAVDLVRITVPAGLAAGRHHHEHEQFVQVISGSGELDTEQGLKRFGPGSLFVFPAGTWHAARFE